MKRSVLAVVATLGLLFAIWTPMASGQAVYGSIIGTVTDPSGAAVPNAKVTVSSQTKGTSVETTSNDSGNYSVTHLIPDVYSVRIEGQGFKTLQLKDIPVSADAAANVNAHFQVGSTSEQVEVTAEVEEHPLELGAGRWRFAGAGEEGFEGAKASASLTSPADILDRP